jgi:hypothetical protein
VPPRQRLLGVSGHAKAEANVPPRFLLTCNSLILLLFRICYFFVGVA